MYFYIHKKNLVNFSFIIKGLQIEICVYKFLTVTEKLNLQRYINAEFVVGINPRFYFNQAAHLHPMTKLKPYTFLAGKA